MGIQETRKECLEETADGVAIRCRRKRDWLAPMAALIAIFSIAINIYAFVAYLPATNRVSEHKSTEQLYLEKIYEQHEKQYNEIREINLRLTRYLDDADRLINRKLDAAEAISRARRNPIMPPSQPAQAKKIKKGRDEGDDIAVIFEED